jgi:hypothetical protein
LCSRKIKNDAEERSWREGVKEKGEQQGADPRTDRQVRQDHPWVSAQEADRRRIGKDRLLGEGDQRNTKNISHTPGKKAERATGINKRGLESPPIPGEEKEGQQAQGLL